MRDWTRRDVIGTSAGLGIAAIANPARALRRGTEAINVGVIGCGGRGTGAAVNAMQADPAVRIVAMGDLFPDRLRSSHGYLAGLEDFADRVTVAPEHMFSGFDNSLGVVGVDGVDMVILATPPHFRPIHFKQAIDAGKHVFMEKPAAADPTGVRMVIEAAVKADARGLSVVAGTQRRHEKPYLSFMNKIHEGWLGDLVSASCYWNQGGLWVHDRKPEYSDMEWQCRNWLYFCWLSGDHICEQHVHNLDVINWAAGGPPAKAIGMGGREVRTADKYGNIFDHFAVEYEYPSGLQLTSMCRQTDGCAGRVAEFIRGKRGTSRSWSGHASIDNRWEYKDDKPNPYVQEHVDLIASIRGDIARLNEAKRIAESTLTAIMGRMSAYTGKEVTWEQAMSSTLDLSPSAYEFGDLPVRAVPTPGRTPLV